MKTSVQTSYCNLFRLCSSLKRYKISGLVLMLAGLASGVHAQSIWNGSVSSDWENAANWSAGLPNGVNARISSTSPNIATISNSFSVTPMDIQVGWTGNGRVDHISGNAATGDGNWMLLGIVGNQATYNFADTRTSGGTFTGFGQGSGNLNVGGSLQNGNLLVGLDPGTVSTLNINSSGTLSAGGLFASGAGANTGIVNMDSGTVNISGEVQIGGSFYGNGSVGRLNMSGGTFTANIISFSRGSDNTAAITGTANLTGGTLNAGQFFTLGFAGSSSSLAAVTNNGATVNINTAGGGNLEMGIWDPINLRFVLNSGSVNVQNSGSMVFGVLGQSGTGTFEQNGGTVAFYGDAGTTVGGSGGIVLGSQGANPWEISTGTYNYNLNGGTLTVPQISRVSTVCVGNFNFNGGTLKAAGYTSTFMQGLSAANIQSGGANIDTDGYDITIGQPVSGTGVLTKLGAGTLTLTGTNTYVGNTIISGGTLALSGTGTLASQVIIPSGKTFDVSSLAVGIQNPVSGVGSVNGSATSAVGMDIYPATDGTAGTLTFNNDLNMSAGGSIRLDLSTSYNSGNDQVVVSGNLTVSSSTVIRIKALSGAANLSTAGDYVLCAVTGTTTMGSTPALAWDGTTPANYLNYSVQLMGNNLVLHYAAATAPTLTATSSPGTLVRNQAVTVTATVTPGTGLVTNVVADASQIGGSATSSLILSGTPNVYTNTFTVAPGTAPGVKFMSVVAYANSGLSSPAYTVTNTVVATNETWTGLGANDNWTTSPNWNVAAPASSGDAVTFAGTTRLTPNVDNNYALTGITFNSGAGSFNIASDNGSSLTLTANGVVNNSANPQTLNVPVTLSVPQTLNAAAGSLLISNALYKGGNLLTVTGAASTVISGPVSDSGSLFKKGSGWLTVSSSATWDLAQASSGGFSGPLIAQAGTLAFNNGSYQTVSGELVIGGIATTNGGAGNNAKIVVDNATLNVSTWLSVGRGNGVGSVSSDLVVTNGGSVSAQDASAGYNANNTNNLPKGSITLSDTSSLNVAGGSVIVGESSGSDMTLNVNGSATVSAANATMTVAASSGKGAVNINGGSVSVGALRVGIGASATSTAQGTVTVNSGTLNNEGDVMLGFAGSSTDSGKLVINGGTVNVATATKRWVIMSQYDTANSELDVNGGTLNVNAGTDIRFAISGNNGTNTINLNSGAITFYSDNATTIGGSGVVDLHQGDGGTVQNTFNLNGGTLSVFGIQSANAAGTRTFNFNGGTLKAVADNPSFLDLGTGSASASVRAGGAVIDTAGFNVTIAQALVNNGVDQDGGLTKNGNGTLTLAGSNTYTNNTTVNAGTLALPQPTLSAVGTVTVASGAMLQLDFSSTTTNQVKALVLNGVSQAPGVYNAATSPSFISGTGNLLVASPINPNPPQIQVSVSGSQMTLAWPANAGWILQSNSVGLANSSAWFNYPANGAVDVTTVNITMNPATTNVFFRMLKP